MHRQRSKKIFFYFFLFLIIGTLNNKNFEYTNFAQLKEITVTGLDEIDNKKLIENLNLLRINNLYSLDKNQIIEILNLDNSIEKYSVFKKYPSSINIEINKTKILAKLSVKGKNFLLGSNGKLIEKKDEEYDVPFIFGNFEIKNFFELREIIKKTGFDFYQIKNLFFFKSGRWDIETKKGVLIKLPSDNLEESLNLYNLFINDYKEGNIMKIDLRQKNQVIIDE
tara:strand:- start:253 stop:924 length:672 start_codon:yes stop_codon:yes gene_type:complete